ncbi:microviridin/marinostatin family tricyclic proteinase inhibitor [Nostoc sp.]
MLEKVLFFARFLEGQKCEELYNQDALHTK